MSDMGRIYTFEVDKSAANAILQPSNLRLASAGSGNRPLLPIGLSPRFFSCYDRSSPNRRRRFVFANNTQLPEILLDGGGFITTQDTLPNNDITTWVITGYTGEVYRNMPIILTSRDTGLSDGDITQ